MENIENLTVVLFASIIRKREVSKRTDSITGMLDSLHHTADSANWKIVGRYGAFSPKDKKEIHQDLNEAVNFMVINKVNYFLIRDMRQLRMPTAGFVKFSKNLYAKHKIIVVTQSQVDAVTNNMRPKSSITPEQIFTSLLSPKHRRK